MRNNVIIKRQGANGREKGKVLSCVWGVKGRAKCYLPFAILFTPHPLMMTSLRLISLCPYLSIYPSPFFPTSFPLIGGQISPYCKICRGKLAIDVRTNALIFWRIQYENFYISWAGKYVFGGRGIIQQVQLSISCVIGCFDKCHFFFCFSNRWFLTSWLLHLE